MNCCTSHLSAFRKGMQHAGKQWLRLFPFCRDLSAEQQRRIQQPVKQQERADSALVFALGFRRPNASAVCQRFPQRKSLLEEGRSEAERQPKSLFREGEKEKKRFPSCHKSFRLLLSRTEAISIPRNRQNHMGGGENMTQMLL